MWKPLVPIPPCTRARQPQKPDLPNLSFSTWKPSPPNIEWIPIPALARAAREGGWRKGCARRDSNAGPFAPEANALSRLSYGRGRLHEQSNIARRREGFPRPGCLTMQRSEVRNDHIPGGRPPALQALE